jgi:hypothetical protein
MTRKPLPEAPDPRRGSAQVNSARPRRRMILEALEPRTLYSAGGPDTVLSPLLSGAPDAQSNLLGVTAPQRVEVATVRATGEVGPFVRINITWIEALRAEAAARGDADAGRWSHSIFDRDSGTHDSDRGGVLARPSAEDSDSAAVTNRAAARAEARAAWRQIRAALPSLEADGGADSAEHEIAPPIATASEEPSAAPVAGADGIGNGPTTWSNPVVGIIDRGTFIPLAPYREPVVPWTVNPGVLGTAPAGTVSESVVNVTAESIGGDASLTLRGAPAATSASVEAAAFAPAVASGGDAVAAVGDARVLDATAGTQAGGKAVRSAVAEVVRGEEEDDDDGRRAVRGHTRDAARDHESVITGGNAGGIVGGDASATNGTASGAARGLLTLGGISAVASLLSVGDRGAADDASATADSIVTAPVNGLAAMAAAADAGLKGLGARAGVLTDLAGAAVAGRAAPGTRRVFELARAVASAVGVPPAAPAFDDGSAATEARTFDVVRMSMQGTLLGLAPVWNWAGPESQADAEQVADRVWRVAAAGSLIATMIGCWYCATAPKRQRNSRGRRLADRARFAATRRIQFDAQPV